MALIAKIDNVDKRGSFVHVTVTYADTTAGFAAQNIISFPDDVTTTPISVRDRIILNGAAYKTKLEDRVTVQTKTGDIGTTVNL